MDLTWLVEALVVPLIERLLVLLEDQVIKLINVSKDLRELLITIVKVQDTLKEYEGREVRTEHGLLLLQKLNEAMYDSEDVVQDCWIKAKKRSREEEDAGSGGDELVRLPSCSFSRFVPNLAFRYQIGCRIREIKAEIEKVLPEIKQLQLNPAAEDHDHKNSARSITDLYPGIELDDIIGLEGEKASLLERLTSQNSKKKIKENIHAITGMPGIGKTTLAKMVFNSPEADSYFGITRIWLPVTEHCEDHELLKLIVETIDKEQYNNNLSRTGLLRLVETLVRNKQLLVVLDDCWSSKVWTEVLLTPLSKAADGSAVLITTRNIRVAKDMNAREFDKAWLSTEHGWNLLRKIVFHNRGEDGSELEDVGKQIVEKCKGVPLAIKAIGGVLKRKRAQVGVWRDICSNNIWTYDSLPDHIMPALLLSYMDLPYHLKLCFSHCSLFPENFTFHCQGIVQLWIAEGFVPKGSGADMQEKSTECYKELISRNLLQSEASYYDDKGSTMHSVMRALADYVSSQCFVKLKRSTNTRHRYGVANSWTVVPDIKQKQAAILRSLVLSKNPIEEIPKGYLENLHRLRVLDLSYTGITKLPRSVANLQYLRFLNLSFTRITELPESIGKLINLESLQLHGSKRLKKLPKGVVELTHLQCLTLGGTDAALDCLPIGIGQLQELRRLNGFLVNKDICNMKDLEKLTLLTELTLDKLERIGCPDEAQEAIMQNKTKVTHLRLSCSSNCDEQSSLTNNIEQVFEKLHPPRECISVHIDGYFGKAFPSWMTTVSFPYLEWLRLEKCKFCEQLPPLGQLPKLKVLDIRTNSAVTKIGSDFYGTVKFPQLEEIYFIELENLQRWSGFDGGTFPCLKKLEIIKCSTLKRLPRGMHLLTSLRELIIEEADKLQEIKDIPSLVKLRIRRNPQLKEISNIPNADFMKIRRCSSLKEIRGLASLRHLALSDDKMEWLPEWLKNMNTLKRLELEVNKVLLVRILTETSEKSKFEHIEHVKARFYTENKDRLVINQKQQAENSQNDMVDSNFYVSYTRSTSSFASNLQA